MPGLIPKQKVNRAFDEAFIYHLYIFILVWLLVFVSHFLATYLGS